MMGFSVLLGKELREQFRTYRLPIVAILFLTLGMGSAALAKYTPELIKAFGGEQYAALVATMPKGADQSVDQLLKNLSQFGILVAILLAMGSVASEKANGTAGMVLTKPASRGSFLASKLAAVSLNLLIATALACAFGYVYTGLLFDTWLPVGGFAVMTAMLWLTLVFYAALTFLGSTLTRSALAAAGLGFLAFILTGLLSVIPVVGDYIPQSLGKPARAFALGMDPGTFWGPLVVCIVSIFVLFGISWASFRRQEL